MRAALYLRYSSDRQDGPNSIARQRAACLAWAKREGATVVAEHADEAVSGSLLSRPGLQAIIRALRAKSPPPWDAVLIDDASRLDRGGHLAELVRLFASRGVRLIAVDTGRDLTGDDERLMVHVQAGLSEHYLHELARRTRAGLAQRALRGLWTGGRIYGYRLIREDGGTRVEIDAEQAKVVRELFRRYAAGAGLRELADLLNRRGEPSPRGKAWDQSAIRAMLRNPRYAGEWRWNVTRWRRAPQTLDGGSGARKVRRNAAAEVIAETRPDLRIVPRGTWDAVAARFAARTGQRRRPPTRSPLAGLLRCACGAPMVRSGGGKGAPRLRCAFAANRGSSVCAQGSSISEDVILDAIADWIDRRLGSPKLLRAVAAGALRAAEVRARKSRRDPARARAEVARLEAEIGRLADALAAGVDVPAVRAALIERQVALDRARERLAPEPGARADLTDPKAVAAHLRRSVAAIRKGGEAARDAVRDVLAGAVVRQTRLGLRVEVAIRPAAVGLTGPQKGGSGGLLRPVCGRVAL